MAAVAAEVEAVEAEAAAVDLFLLASFPDLAFVVAEDVVAVTEAVVAGSS